MKIIYTSQFKKDYKRLIRQSKNMKLLKNVIKKLSKGEELPAKYKNHKLAGRWSKHRQCHIRPDWLLIYRVRGNELFLERMGSHSDLFR